MALSFIEPELWAIEVCIAGMEILLDCDRQTDEQAEMPQGSFAPYRPN